MLKTTSFYSSLSQWVIETPIQNLFTPCEKLESAFIKEVYYIKNNKLNLNCLIFIVSDRYVSIPVLVQEEKAKKEFGITDLGETEIQEMYNQILTFKKSAIAIYLHQSTLYPYVIAIDWSLPHVKTPKKLHPQPIYTNPKLKHWLLSLKHIALPHQSLPSVCFPNSSIHNSFPRFHHFESIIQKFLGDAHHQENPVIHVTQTDSAKHKEPGVKGKNSNTSHKKKSIMSEPTKKPPKEFTTVKPVITKPFIHEKPASGTIITNPVPTTMTKESSRQLPNKLTTVKSKVVKSVPKNSSVTTKPSTQTIPEHVLTKNTKKSLNPLPKEIVIIDDDEPLANENLALVTKAPTQTNAKSMSITNTKKSLRQLPKEINKVDTELQSTLLANENPIVTTTKATGKPLASTKMKKSLDQLPKEIIQVDTEPQSTSLTNENPIVTTTKATGKPVSTTNTKKSLRQLPKETIVVDTQSTSLANENPIVTTTKATGKPVSILSTKKSSRQLPKEIITVDTKVSKVTSSAQENSTVATKTSTKTTGNPMTSTKTKKSLRQLPNVKPAIPFLYSKSLQKEPVVTNTKPTEPIKDPLKTKPSTTSSLPKLSPAPSTSSHHSESMMEVEKEPEENPVRSRVSTGAFKSLTIFTSPIIDTPKIISKEGPKQHVNQTLSQDELNRHPKKDTVMTKVQQTDTTSLSKLNPTDRATESSTTVKTTTSLMESTHIEPSISTIKDLSIQYPVTIVNPIDPNLNKPSSSTTTTTTIESVKAIPNKKNPSNKPIDKSFKSGHISHGGVKVTAVPNRPLSISLPPSFHQITPLASTSPQLKTKKIPGLTSSMNTRMFIPGTKRSGENIMTIQKKAKTSISDFDMNSSSSFPQVDLKDNSDLIEAFNIADEATKSKKKKTTRSVMHSTEMLHPIPSQLNTSSVELSTHVSENQPSSTSDTVRLSDKRKQEHTIVVNKKHKVTKEDVKKSLQDKNKLVHSMETDALTRRNILSQWKNLLFSGDLF